MKMLSIKHYKTLHSSYQLFNDSCKLFHATFSEPNAALNELPSTLENRKYFLLGDEQFCRSRD
jgi:hypothetical protein